MKFFCRITTRISRRMNKNNGERERKARWKSAFRFLSAGYKKERLIFVCAILISILSLRISATPSSAIEEYREFVLTGRIRKCRDESLTKWLRISGGRGLVRGDGWRFSCSDRDRYNTRNAETVPLYSGNFVRNWNSSAFEQLLTCMAAAIFKICRKLGISTKPDPKTSNFPTFNTKSFLFFRALQLLRFLLK